MDRNDSHGRHGGNRGSADTRTDDNPNKAASRTNADAQADNRNPAKAGGKSLGGR